MSLFGEPVTPSSATQQLHIPQAMPFDILSSTARFDNTRPPGFLLHVAQAEQIDLETDCDPSRRYQQSNFVKCAMEARHGPDLLTCIVLSLC